MSVGSITAKDGKRFGWSNEYFLLVCLFQTVAQRVTSLPVPDVVGMAIMGSSNLSKGCCFLFSRNSVTMLKSPLEKDRTLAVSMTEPPPKATSTSVLSK